MCPCKLSAFKEEHIEAVIALQNNLMPAHKRWTAKDVRSSLMDSVHEHGRNVLLAWDTNSGRLCGLGSWIIGGNGESFGAPFIVANREAAILLLDSIETEVRKARAHWLRVITLPFETPKARALEEKHFKRTFDFVEFEINPLTLTLPEGAGFPEGLTRIEPAKIDFAKYVETGNLAFSGIDNALPLSEAEAREIWKTECDTELSVVLADPHGNYVGFTVVTSKGYIDSVGVHPDYQGRGIARSLYAAVFKTAGERKMDRLHTVVSSKNVASLRLHKSMGFRESERRQVWELTL